MTFLNNRITARLMAPAAALALLAGGLLSTPFAHAQDNEPTPPKASCTYNNKTTSDGGYIFMDGGEKARCDNGSWTITCSGNCGAPTKLTGGKGLGGLVHPITPGIKSVAKVAAPIGG